MFVQMVAQSPEIFLLMGLPIMFLLNKYRKNKTSKTFYSVSKIMLLFSILSGIIFYNRSGYAEYVQNNTYTTLYKIFVQIFGLGIFFLSCKWFLNKNRSSLQYYAYGTGLIVSLMILISSVHFLVLSGAYFISSLLIYYLMRLSSEDYEYEMGNRRYFVFMFMFSLMILLSGLWFYHKIGSWEYAKIAAYYAKHAWNRADIMAFAGILLPLLYMLGIAPLHFNRIEQSGLSILPVGMINQILPVIGAYAVILNLLINVFSTASSIYLPFLRILSIVSLFWGAISATKEDNLRRLFGYCCLYSVGFIMLGLLPFNNNGITSSFVYLIAYLLTIFGVYSVFFAFKSNGEYVSSLQDISGIFSQKPYVSVLLTAFIVSFAGSPPMLGFLGKLQSVENMIREQDYWSIGLAMLALLLLLNAFFRVIRVMFFEIRTKNFDRTDRGIYFCLFLNMIFFLVGVLNPALFIEQFETLLQPIMR